MTDAANAGFVIYGSGGHARELMFQLQQDGHAVVAVVDDHRGDGVVGGVPLSTTDAALDAFPGAQWLVAIGSPAARRRVSDELAGRGVVLGGFVSRKATIAPGASIASNVQIFANAVVSDACSIGAGAIVHFGAIICHDSRIGAFTIICPGASIAGNVDVGDDVWFGVGASCRNGLPEAKLTIGNGAFVGAGACVVGPVQQNTTVVGVPAKPRPA